MQEKITRMSKKLPEIAKRGIERASKQDEERAIAGINEQLEGWEINLTKRWRE